MTKIKIEIKNRWTGEILFEYEKENNTIKDTLVEAVSRGADLRDAYLRDAYLRGADLRDADLCGADLRDANLCGAYLRDANLCDADLRDANLCGADLRDANLRDANLCDADLRDADLRDADLRDADLCGANLCGADLCGADLRDAKNIPYFPFACPSDGAFIGWKKVNGKLVKLLIPDGARRCSATSQKCRCDKAMVLAITDIDGSNPIDEVLNTSQDANLLYKVGEIAYPDEFTENRWDECSHGIHFFINKQDAINY